MSKLKRSKIIRLAKHKKPESPSRLYRLTMIELQLQLYQKGWVGQKYKTAGAGLQPAPLNLPSIEVMIHQIYKI